MIRNTKYLILFIPLLILSWYIPAKAQFDISLSPLLVEVDLAPGAKKTFTLMLTNENALNSVELLAYTMDLAETKMGSYQVADKGESEYSCADWMSIEDTSFTLKPSESREVKVIINVPRNVFGGRYGAVVFEIVPEKAPEGEKLGSVMYHFRMPAFVEVTVKRFGGLIRKASISDFKVEPISTRKLPKELGDEALSFTASVKNEGNIHVKGNGTLIIKDKEGKTKRRVPLGSGRGVVIPGATLNFQSILKKPPPGEYMARVMISFGGLSPTIAEVPFSVTRTKSSALGSFTASSFIALEIKPEKLEMNVPRKGFRAFTFSFRNDERDTVEVNAYLKDITYDEEGIAVLSDTSEIGRSCKDWIEFEPEEFEIAPEKSSRVKLTLNAPEEASGGYYACVVFDVLLKGSKKEGVISTPFQIPVIVSVPPDLDKKGEVVDVAVEAAAGRPATFITLFQNKGNIHIKPRGKIVLKYLREIESTDDFVVLSKPEYEKVGEVIFEEIDHYILPGSMRTMQAAFGGALEAGKYVAEINIDYGGTERAIFTKEFIVK